MKIAKLDPDPGASISLSGDPYLLRNMEGGGKRCLLWLLRPCKGLVMGWGPLASLPPGCTSLTSFKDGHISTLGRALPHSLWLCILQNDTYLAVLGDQLDQQGLEMGLGKNRFYHLEGQSSRRTEEKAGPRYISSFLTRHGSKWSAAPI